MRHHRLTRSIALAFAFATLAAPAVAADPAERALHLRSQALNERYVAAETTTPAERALHLRSEGLNARYVTVAAPAVSAPSSGFDWADAAVGAAGMLLGLSVLSLGAVAIRRARHFHTIDT
jgi:hypothetical protein